MTEDSAPVEAENQPEETAVEESTDPWENEAEGTAEPAPEPEAEPEAETEPEAEGEAESEAEPEPEKAPEKTVPYAALHEERQLRKEAAVENAEMRDKVISELSAAVRLNQAPLSFTDDSKRQFILQLVIPALGFVCVNQIMNRILGLFRIGMWPDDTDIKFPAVLAAALTAVKPNGSVEYSGIGPVIFNQVPACNVLRRVNILPDGKRDGTILG